MSDNDSALIDEQLVTRDRETKQEPHDKVKDGHEGDDANDEDFTPTGKKRGNASPKKAGKAAATNKKAKRESNKGVNGDQASGCSGGPSKAARPGAWTPEMRAELFRNMLQTPGMALFNEIGPKVGKSGSQVKDQWRGTLYPMLLKKIEESG